MKSAKNSMKRRTIVIDGVHYYAERPHDCRKCFFWKNRKVGCSLGSENCYYLAEVVKTEQEKKCESCPYAKGGPCVTASCYKDLEKWLRDRRAKAVQRIMQEDRNVVKAQRNVNSWSKNSVYDVHDVMS